MTFRKMGKADWDAVMKTNLDSVFNMTKQVYDGMMDPGWGRIINVSSVNGSKGAFGQTNYAAAKAGMHGFTKSLALESARIVLGLLDLRFVGRDPTVDLRPLVPQCLDDQIIFHGSHGSHNRTCEPALSVVRCSIMP